MPNVSRNYIFQNIGDTHIGKKFKTGVPLDRLGEREELIFKAFEQQLKPETSNVNFIIHQGDLFDKPTISYTDLMRTTELIKEAALVYHQTMYVFIAGNHDLHRDTEKWSAFEIAKSILSPLRNVLFVVKEPVKLGDFLFVPYSFTQTPLEQVANYEAEIMFGHLDEPFPYEVIKKFEKVYTGHIHTPRVEGNVVVTGSILPMSFAEDPEARLYKTFSSLEELRNTPSEQLKDLCIRVNLKDGEEIPHDINCRQMISMRDSELDPEGGELEVGMEGLDMEVLLHEALDPTGLFNEIYEKYLQMKVETDV